MPEMPDSPDWATRLSESVAREVRRNREMRGMSAQQLSDECGKLGLPIHRSVISNFENGRRGNLSIAELLVIAKALDVAPIFLLFPVGFSASIEALPGWEAVPMEAVSWFAADRERRTSFRDRSPETATPFQLVINEVPLVKGFTWDIRNGLHIPGTAQAYVDGELPAAQEAMAAGAEVRRLRERLKRIEEADEHASPEEIAELRRELEEAARRRRSADDDQSVAHDRAGAAQDWLDSGGLEARVEEISAIRREMARRGMVRDPLPSEVASYFDEDVR